jgi:hypothetical protein
MASAASYDVYLVLHPFRANVREFQILTRPLGDLDALYLDACEGFYAPEVDVALAVLCFSQRARARLGPKLIHQFAGRSGLPMVVPEQLPTELQHQFLIEHMEIYTTYVQQYASKAETMPLVERTIVRLAEHLDPLPRPRTETELLFDVEAELPVLNPRKRARPGWMRAESVL